MAAYDNKCASCSVQLGVCAKDHHIDHIHALGLGGSNADDNLQPLCIGCHNWKTNRGKATSYGSDKHAIAKAKRLEKERLGECCGGVEKHHVPKRHKGPCMTRWESSKRDVGSRGLASGPQHSPKRPIPSRGFDKRYRKRFDGTVERRK
ncbi:MAG: HNH endonuclease [Gammaproteobacteria bacterium]